MKTPVYVIDILRTPVGKFGGTLAAIRPDDLAAHVIQSILARNPNIDRLVEVFQPSYRTPLLHKEANIKFTDA
jgi:acetyl-CoA acetyltransferase